LPAFIQSAPDDVCWVQHMLVRPFGLGIKHIEGNTGTGKVALICSTSPISNFSASMDPHELVKFGHDNDGDMANPDLTQLYQGRRGTGLSAD
jgi:hypothetical protein